MGVEIGEKQWKFYQKANLFSLIFHQFFNQFMIELRYIKSLNISIKFIRNELN